MTVVTELKSFGLFSLLLWSYVSQPSLAAPAWFHAPVTKASEYCGGKSLIIDLDAEKFATIQFDSTITRSSISDSSIAEVKIVHGTGLRVQAKALGCTEILVCSGANDCERIRLVVTHTRDFEALRTILRKIDPGIFLDFDSERDSIVLRGEVDRPETIIKAFAAGLVFMDDRGMNGVLKDGTLINSRFPYPGPDHDDEMTKQRTEFRANFGRDTQLVSDGRRVSSLMTSRSVGLP